MTPDRITEFVAQLPKCELHLHFEGAVPIVFVHRWSKEFIPSRPPWREHDYRYESFALDFREVMRVTWRDVCTSLERIDEASTRIYEDLFVRNVRYLEMSFGIGAYPYPVSETLAAFKSGVPQGMTVRIIGGLSRDRDTPFILKAGAETIKADALDGIDLHGNERVGNPGVFRGLYESAQSRGLIIKAHAGEFGGPDSIEEVMDALQVKRIQHGVRGIESDRLIQRYIDEDITLDTCPWSNVKLGVYPDLKTHPVADLHRAGVRVTVNTDDPTPFGQTISDEYGWLMSEREMRVEEVGAIAKNGFEIARMPDDARAAAVTEIDRLVAEYAGDNS